MAVEIKGKIVEVTELQKGNSNGKDWSKQNVIIEEIEGQYPQKIALELFNKELTVKVGDLVNAFVNLSSREYNGNWYTSIKLWKFDVVGVSHEEVAPAQEANNNEFEDDGSGLPF